MLEERSVSEAGNTSTGQFQLSTAEKTSAGSSTSSIQNFENESMLDAGSILVQRLMVGFKIVKMSLCQRNLNKNISSLDILSSMKSVLDITACSQTVIAP